MKNSFKIGASLLNAARTFATEVDKTHVISFVTLSSKIKAMDPIALKSFVAQYNNFRQKGEIETLSLKDLATLSDDKFLEDKVTRVEDYIGDWQIGETGFTTEQLKKIMLHDKKFADLIEEAVNKIDQVGREKTLESFKERYQEIIKPSETQYSSFRFPSDITKKQVPSEAKADNEINDVIKEILQRSSPDAVYSAFDRIKEQAEFQAKFLGSFLKLVNCPEYISVDPDNVPTSIAELAKKKTVESPTLADELKTALKTNREQERFRESLKQPQIWSLGR